MVKIAIMAIRRVMTTEDGRASLAPVSGTGLVTSATLELLELCKVTL